MSVFLAVILAAAPASCDQLWSDVWTAYAARELTGEPPPLFVRLPDAKDRLARAWIAECGRFSKQTLECARGVELERELLALHKRLVKEKVPLEELARLIAKTRGEWSILECREVEAAIDRAGRAVAKDAGLEK
jgi:hypothetical protein